MVLYHQQFYESPILEDQEHTLVITYTVGDVPLWLDYFEVEHAVSSLPSTSIIPTVTPTTTPAPTMMKAAPISKGVIAGVAIGGIVIVALVGAIIWFIFRHKARQGSPSDAHSVQPFTGSHSNCTQSFARLHMRTWFLPVLRYFSGLDSPII